VASAHRNWVRTFWSALPLVALRGGCQPPSRSPLAIFSINGSSAASVPGIGQCIANALCYASGELILSKCAWMVNTIVTTLVTCWTTGKAVGWCAYSYYMNCLWESNPTNPVTVISAPTHLLTERLYHVTFPPTWSLPSLASQPGRTPRTLRGLAHLELYYL